MHTGKKINEYYNNLDQYYLDGVTKFVDCSVLMYSKFNLTTKKSNR